MKGKLKKIIAFSMVLAMIFSISNVAYADINNDELKEPKELATQAVLPSDHVYLTYAADSNVQETNSGSPNDKTQARLLWTYDGELYVALIGSLKEVVNVSYNGTVYNASELEIEVATEKTHLLTVDGKTYNYPTQVNDKDAHWVIINLGPQILTTPFKLGIKTTAGGFDAWDKNAMTVNITSALQVYHQYGATLLDLNQSGDITNNAYSVHPVYENEGKFYRLTGINRVINEVQDSPGLSDLVNGNLEGTVDAGSSVKITFNYEEIYKVNFDQNYTGAPAIVTMDIAPNTSFGSGMPGDPAREGYIFAGWYPNADGTGTAFTAETAVTGNMTVYAKWTQGVVNYTVTFDENYEGAPTAYTRTATANSALGDSMPGDPTREGYIFVGWYPNAEGTGTAFTAETAVTGNMTVYAKWTQGVVNYTVTFNENYEGAPATYTRTVAANATLGDSMPGTPERTGYIFAGWYPNAEGTGTRFTSSTVVTENMTVYAKWTPVVVNSYTVTFDENYEGAPAAVTRDIMPNATLGDSMPVEPKREGYVFEGWYQNAVGTGTKFTASTPVTGNMTVYAKWTPVVVNYTVTFDENYEGAPAVYTRTVAANATLGDSMPGTPERTGYIFAGWYPNAEGTGTRFTSSTVVTENTTVYAKWTPVVVNSYTVTFNENYAGAPEAVTKDVMPNATLGDSMPEDPTREGYTFEGWFSDANGAQPEFTANTPVTGNITVYAKWTQDVVNYTVTFNENYEGAPAAYTRTVAANATLGDSMPGDPTREGYVFAGWYPNAEGTAFTAETTVTGNITVYAKWIQGVVIYTVTFNENYNEVPTTYTRTAVTNTRLGDSMPEDPVRAGYSFEGWFSNTVGTGTAFTFDTLVNGNITVYAKWTFDGEVSRVSYLVNYLERLTNRVLAEAKEGIGNLGAEITESAITISGYNKVAPTSATITLALEGNVINFYYTKKAAPQDNDDHDNPSTPGMPDLKVTKTDNGSVVSPGGLVEYVITVENKGNAPAEDVKVYEVQPEGATFVADRNQGWVLADGKYVYSLGTLNVGDKKEARFILKVNDPFPAGLEKILNNVEVKDNGTETATTDNKASDDTPILIAKTVVAEPPVTLPPTPTPEPTVNDETKVPDLPFTGGVAEVELLFAGMGALLMGAGLVLRRK